MDLFPARGTGIGPPGPGAPDPGPGQAGYLRGYLLDPLSPSTTPLLQPSASPPPTTHTHPEPSPAQSAWLGFRPLVLSRRRPPGRNTPGSEKSALQVAGLTRRKLSEARSEFDPLSWLRLHEGWNGSEEGFPTGSGAPNLKRCPKLEKSSLFGVGPYHGPITSV